MTGAPIAARLRWSDFDPFRLLWRGLTSVRFALALIGFLAAASLIGVLVPQLPAEMRGNAAAEAAWLEMQRGRFGLLTGPMDAIGLFQVFRSLWFTSSLALLVASVCVCTANRLPPVWRNVFQPQTRVPDEYLDRSPEATAVECADAEALARELRRRRFRVVVAQEGEAAYLFADRFPWSQFATFVTHLALILFLAGGLVTLLTAKQVQVFVAEGEAARPVFALDDPDHMQVYVEDAVGRFDATGFPLEYRTELVVYRDGREIGRGPVTVSHPLSAGGYRFHQSAYFPDGAALRVRDLASGRVVFDEVLALVDQATTPRIIVKDTAGAVLVDDAIVPTDFLGDAAGTTIRIPGTERQFWVGARPGDSETPWQLVVFETSRPGGVREIIAPGASLDLGGLQLEFAGVTSIPSSAVSGLPGAQGAAVAELSEGPDGLLLTVGPVAGRALALSPGQPVIVDGYEYTFEGRREFAGLTVRRDPGSTF
ncbi:MAG TPA: cytochrome c biogenesis protein ResB, partial [Dehalococcoidia bacterium]|nr:cytochrome c biogenesis protein ResB [Dehalococcoidia bacterium]